MTTDNQTKTITETWSETDGFGLARMVQQAGAKRRYSYDAGMTWRATAKKARAAAGILSATITSVHPHVVTAERHWGKSDPDGTRNIYLHELQSPGITRHSVGDVIALEAVYATGCFDRVPTAVDHGLRERGVAERAPSSTPTA